MTQSNLSAARGHVQKLRAALSAPTPQAIEECLPGLMDAAECLKRVQSEIAQGGGHDIAFELHSLKRDLAGAKRLIGQGAAFYRGWANTLGAAAGYTASGEAAPISAARKISVRG